MEITQVTVEYGKTISDGNYGSERLSIGYTVTVPDGATEAQAEALERQVCAELRGVQWPAARRSADRRS